MTIEGLTIDVNKEGQVLLILKDSIIKLSETQINEIMAKLASAKDDAKELKVASVKIQTIEKRYGR